MEKSTIVLTTLVVVLAVSTLYLYTNFQGQINALNSNKIVLQDLVNGLNSDKNSLQSQLNSLNTTFLNYISSHSRSNSEYVTLNETYRTLLLNHAALDEAYERLLANGATFEVSNLVVNPSIPESGDSVNISVLVTNLGSLKGIYTLDFKINGTTKSTKEVVVDGHSSVNASVLVDLLYIGKHYVDVNGLTGNFSVTNPTWFSIGVPYVAADGLTLTLQSLSVIEQDHVYKYTIFYTLKNENPYQRILEGAFRMYYKDLPGGVQQSGYFVYINPGDTIARGYAFEEIESKPFDVLEYYHNNALSPEPLTGSLKWKVEIS